MSLCAETTSGYQINAECAFGIQRGHVLQLECLSATVRVKTKNRIYEIHSTQVLCSS